MILKIDRKTFLKELFRKTIHICSAVVPFFLEKFYWPTIITLFVVVCLYCLAEFLRFKGHNVPLISLITVTAARKENQYKFVMGPVTLVLGILLAALVLPLEYARVGIYALSFGDGLASLVGKSVGRVIIPHTGGKTLAGSLACFAAVFTVTYIISRHLLISLFVGLCAMLIEVLPLKDYDNLIIPIAIGSWFALLTKLFGL